MSRIPNKPSGSVVLVASAGSESISRTMRALSAQTIAHQLEVVLAARPEHVEDLRQADASAFFAIKVVPSDFTTSAIARVAAIRAAEADVLLLVEDHSFPTTDVWAERLIRAHDAGHVAVGPRMENANPASATSWANFLIEYGQWAHVPVAGEARQLPGHNSSYKADALRRFGDDLAHMMETEWVLHNRMREAGETLWIDPGVSTAHVNFSKFSSAAKLHYLEGRLFAASRAEHWNPVQRWLFCRRLSPDLSCPLPPDHPGCDRQGRSGPQGPSKPPGITGPALDQQLGRSGRLCFGRRGQEAATWHDGI